MPQLFETLGSTRRKCFISYHHADEDVVKSFVDDFDHNQDVFIRRRLGESPEYLIDSNNPEYVMSQIRHRFLQDSTVTIVMIGRCTWARRYVDWEIQASLRQGENRTPNGLLGIKLPSFARFPERFSANLVAADSAARDCYARHMSLPTNAVSLQSAIEEAFQRRFTHAGYIVNPRDRMKYNRACE